MRLFEKIMYITRKIMILFTVSFGCKEREAEKARERERLGREKYRKVNLWQR